MSHHHHNPFVKKVLALFKKTHEDDAPKHPPGLSAKYTIGDKTLGVGSFAVVKECTERATGEKYAVKIILKKVIAGKLKDMSKRKKESRLIGFLY
jgi:calcium/calmodulin-dependent protein kinase I